MSVGGIVVETRVLEDRVFIATKEREYPNDPPTCIHVTRTAKARAISVGDSVWWMTDIAFWTPRSRTFEDMPLVRIGNSFRAGQQEDTNG